VSAADNARFMAVAITLSERGRGRTYPNPNVGCLIVRDGRIVGRGWTQPGGRPHAEAIALEQAGAAAAGADVYVSLEPCAHESARGPACADLLGAARPRRVIAAIEDPDPRTAGAGFARLRAAGVEVTVGPGAEAARRAMAGFLTRRARGRPHVTLKLATSLDGRIALPDGTSRWITGETARAHAHLERAHVGAILVGHGTYRADQPRLDVRLPGLAERSPDRHILSTKDPFMPSEVEAPAAGDGYDRASLDFARDERSAWRVLRAIEDVAHLASDTLLVEGGAETAAAFLAADLVDRLLLYRAPILIGAGRAAIGDIGLGDLATAHGRWRLIDARTLPPDRLEIYERLR